MSGFANFLKTGSIGPVILGMSPFEVTELLGEPDEASRKKNPLILKYGPLQMEFWRQNGQSKSQLQSMELNLESGRESLPSQVNFDDFPENFTEDTFRSFANRIRCQPVHVVEGVSGKSLILPSGVVAHFSQGTLDTVRVSRKERKDTATAQLSDSREPSRSHILAMIDEANRVLSIGAVRAAMMVAWAGMEATLRRAALRRGSHGKIGVQPSVLIQELVSAGELRPNEAILLEELRQLRTATAHGLAPVELDPDVVPRLNDISRLMLSRTSPNEQRQQDVADVFAIDAIEAFSVIAPANFCRLLFDFFKSRGLNGKIEDNVVVEGGKPHHDIQIEKSIDFKDFVRLLNEWKEEYINGASSE